MILAPSRNVEVLCQIKKSNAARTIIFACTAEMQIIRQSIVLRALNNFNPPAHHPFPTSRLPVPFLVRLETTASNWLENGPSQTPMRSKVWERLTLASRYPNYRLIYFISRSPFSIISVLTLDWRIAALLSALSMKRL